MTRFRTALFILLSFGLIGGMSSCKKKEGCTDPNATNYDPDAEKDDNSCKYDNTSSTDQDMSVPSNYSFDHVDYSGQTIRIQLLDSLVKKISEAENGTQVNAQDLLDIYENNGVIPNTNKDLTSKVYSNDDNMFRNWIQEVETYSGNMNYVVDGRFVNADSVELVQVIEKGLMGACFYYQACDHYLEGLSSDDDSTVTQGKGTERAHHFDEAFGYFGAPKDFSASSPAEVGNSYTDEAWFWGKYCIEMDGAIGNLDKIFKAFREGRTAIVNDNGSERKAAVDIIEREWEKVCAASLVHYLKETKADINNNATGSKYHHWSEAFGFHLSLKYNTDKTISTTQWQSISSDLGSKPGDTDISKLDNALNTLQNVYGFTNAEMQNL